MIVSFNNNKYKITEDWKRKEGFTFLLLFAVYVCILCRRTHVNASKKKIHLFRCENTNKTRGRMERALEVWLFPYVYAIIMCMTMFAEKTLVETGKICNCRREAIASIEVCPAFDRVDNGKSFLSDWLLATFLIIIIILCISIRCKVAEHSIKVLADLSAYSLYFLSFELFVEVFIVHSSASNNFFCECA